MQPYFTSPDVRKSSGSTPIWVGGHIVGKVKDDVFKKGINGSKHLLHKPPAIAISVDSLAQAEHAGATKIEVTDKDNGSVYTCTIEHFKRYSWELQRGGFERQRALPLERWSVSGGQVICAQPISTVKQAIKQPVQLALL